MECRAQVNPRTLRLIPGSLYRFEWPHEQSLFLEMLLDLTDRVLSSVELFAQAHVSTNRRNL